MQSGGRKRAIEDFFLLKCSNLKPDMNFFEFVPFIDRTYNA